MRPECGGLLRNVPVTEPPLTPPTSSVSPYFSDNIDPEKYLKSGKVSIKDSKVNYLNKLLKTSRPEPTITMWF